MTPYRHDLLCLACMCAWLSGCGDNGGGGTATDASATAPTTATDSGLTIATTGSTSEGPSTTEDPTPTTGTTTPAPTCGDGNLDPGEECDDGPANADDNACTASCTNNICGDGLVLAGTEACDDGPANADENACTASCLVNVCGDGHLLAGVETCDDGNLADGDGCSSTCASESCGDGVVQPSEQCDDGNDIDTDDCLPNCIPAMCGDGVVWAGHEDCDDANADDSDVCTSLCAAPACDDGIVSGAETDLDCGGPDCGKCALDAACAADADCLSDVCTSNVCAPSPRTCKEVLALDPQATSGLYPVDLDGNLNTPPVDVYCDMTTDGGGWTIFYAATGADGQQPMVSNTEVLMADPLMFQHYNISRQKKVQLSGLSSETLFVRNNNTWLKADAAAFNNQLTMNNQTVKVAVNLTANNGMTAPGFMGFANYNFQGGGDFGVTQSPDAATCNGTTMMGFDHHGTNYRMLNCGCQRHYLYSYSNAFNDGDAGYDTFIGLGSWGITQANCGNGAAEGGALVFYAAMR